MILDELDLRRAAMAYVAEISEATGGVVTRAQLEAFRYAGEQIKLIDQSRGIRNPRQLSATISILSQPQGPYDDVEPRTDSFATPIARGHPIAATIGSYVKRR